MSFKTFDPANDIASIRSAINEVFAFSGSIYTLDANIKFYKNIASSSADDLGGYWESVYDASPTSSLSTALFDVSYGYATGSSYNTAITVTSSQTEKVKIYRQFASILLGNADSTFTIAGSAKREAFFISLKRNVTKDEIRKGTVGIVLNSAAPTQYTASDQGASVNFKQTVGGDYAPLKYNGTGSEVGLVFYNPGVIVIPADTAWGAIPVWSGTKALISSQYSSSINQLVDGFRRKTERIDLHTQTNLHSTVYFCRALNQEFNYSSNPTYVDANKRIRVTSGSNVLQPRSYITTVGIYGANDDLLAVGKVSKPLVKSPDTEVTLRVRIDY